MPDPKDITVTFNGGQARALLDAAKESRLDTYYLNAAVAILNEKYEEKRGPRG